MNVDKITAIAALLNTGRQHEEAGDQRDAVRAYAEAYQGMQESLVEVHTLWVEAYQELTRQTGPEFESTIPFAAEDPSDEVSSEDEDDIETSPALTSENTASVVEETSSVEPLDETLAYETKETAELADNYKVLQVAKDDVHEEGLLFKSTRSNPFTQAAKDLAAAVVEAASDVAAAVVDARRGKLSPDDVMESDDELSEDTVAGNERLPDTETMSLTGDDAERAPEEEPELNVYEQSSADHKLVVLESLLQQVRSRKNP